MIDAAEAEMLAKTLKEQHEIAFDFEAVDKNGNGLISDLEYVAYDEVLGDRLGIA
jgi:hypothetical protein